MNKIPERGDWFIELRYILALFALMLAIMGGLLLLGAVTHGWAI
jgi:hypothetical protein